MDGNWRQQTGGSTERNRWDRMCGQVRIYKRQQKEEGAAGAGVGGGARGAEGRQCEAYKK